MQMSVTQRLGVYPNTSNGCSEGNAVSGSSRGEVGGRNLLYVVNACPRLHFAEKESLCHPARVPAGVWAAARQPQQLHALQVPEYGRAPTGGVCKRGRVAAQSSESHAHNNG